MDFEMGKFKGARGKKCFKSMQLLTHHLNYAGMATSLPLVSYDIRGLNMRPVHWLMELAISEQQSVEFDILMKELIAEADREIGTMACELNFSDQGDICKLYLRFVDADAAMLHLAMFNEGFIERFLSICSVTGITILGFANDEVRCALKEFSPVVLSQRAGFARFAE